MYVPGVDQQHFEAALLADLVERDPIDPSRLQRHSLHSALREPVRQPVKLGGEGAEFTHRLGVRSGGTATKWLFCPQSIPAASGWIRSSSEIEPRDFFPLRAR